MRLLDRELKDKSVWEKAGIELPGFDREVMKAETTKCPQWVHFGAGNIFRACPAALQQKLLNEGVEKTKPAASMNQATPPSILRILIHFCLLDA